MRSMAHFNPNALQAKQLLFEEGQVPSGLVSDVVLRSWRRCVGEGRKATDNIEFNVVAGRSVHELIERNEKLIAAAEPAMLQMARTVAGIGYTVLLTDASGTALAVHGAVDRLGQLMRKALRPGIDLSEHAVGTSAMTVAMTEIQPVTIHGEEHFFSTNHGFQCVASPILDHHGEVIGSIDLSRDAQGSNCPAISIIASCAASIEAALFLQQPAFAIVRLDWASDTIGQSAAFVSFESDGSLVAASPACRMLLGIPSALTALHFENHFCGRFNEFISAVRKARAPIALRLQNGLYLYASLVRKENRRNQLERVWEGEAPKQTFGKDDFGDERISAVLLKADRALAAELPVLITGETGTGKEVAARVLHGRSKYSQGPFIAINCAAIPKELIEGELFGYSDGAFTGAKRGGAKGKIEQANLGTLFLDEVGDMPLELQTRLLRVLDRREVTRLGDGGTCMVQFQLVCATHQNLNQLVEAGLFREDLYFRIDGFTLLLPPLRSRQDIVSLISKICEEEGMIPSRLSNEIEGILIKYPWPGNVRELRYVIRHIRAMSIDEDHITLEHLPERVRRVCDCQVERPGLVNVSNADVPLLKGLAAKTTEEALGKFNGNITLAAQYLGVSRSTLHRWLKQK